jgi:EpsI family protein
MATALYKGSGVLTPHRAVPTSAWVFALLAFGTIALWPTTLALVRIWGEMADYTHGYIVAAIVAVWLFKARGRVDRTQPTRSWLALGALAVVLIAWLIAHRANSELLQQVLFPLVLGISVAAAAGWRIAMIVAPPLAYLYFGIPLWEHAIPVLQQLTTVAAETALGILQVPASFAGTEVTLPSGKFVIAEDCAGKRYLLVGMTSAVFVGVMQQLPARRMVGLCLGAIALCLVANWLRVIAIIYLGHVTQMQHYLVAVEHVTFGWVVFVPLLIAIFTLSTLLSRGARLPSTDVDGSGSVTMTEQPRRAPRLEAAVLLLVALTAAMTSPASPSSRPELGAMPIITGSWQGPFPATGTWSPRYTGAIEHRQAAYNSVAGTVHVYVNLYESQQQGRELVHYQNSILGAGWSAMGSGQTDEVQRELTAANLRVGRDEVGRDWVVGRFYNIDGTLVATPFAAQLAYGARALLRPVPSGVIALASPCQKDCGAAAQAVGGFWRESRDEFVAMLHMGQ